MVILIKKALLDFALKYPSSSRPLNMWYEIAKAANWNKFSDIREVFNSVDYG